MKEQFDKVLRDHIKDTFDEYDDGMAHDGWLHYQKKLRNKRRRTVLLWTLPSGIAASLLFLMFFSTSDQLHIDDGNKLVVKEKPLKDIVDKENNSPVLSPPLHKESQNRVDKYSADKRNHKLLHNQESYLSNNVRTADNEIIAPIDNHETLVEEFSLNNKEIPASNKTDYRDVSNEESLIAIEKPKSLLDEEENAPVYADIANSRSSFAYDKSQKNSASFKNKLRNLRLSLDASTYMNFSDAGINDHINISIGIVSEYQISKKLSIYSGINVNRQSSSFSHEILATPQDNTMQAMALTNSIASIVNGQFTDAKLVGLDIPINLRYSTNNKKINWFVSSGLSSYALISEKYLNNFSVTRFAFSGVETSTVSTVEEHSESPISSFQFARSVNFSFGVAFPLKKVTTLSIEPFMKYPLKQFGQQNLSLGASGVSVKMHLNKNLFKN
ncbi:hypothetical protein Pedsa_2112 [Pseudopedobacter saltans DSM 12145]|uniref:Uncharacterized protein n=1 Tax=Pseudopedobacter saltans (strain ATCC 51119 / DSM 12145 / JCM 21818 / CCUG 39354 / LMG 10337 / NBRC 100064 / NCIMB 13643) TaxID=762903 RepID=F0SB29_PSESL|nr:outer membrane beta-barrel protein [Pseudopedobacter saltans]ADY52664.1 hypothetical protein Pedsa_2112 [Pseudopedobacter saltans DSM 12145]